MSSFLGEAFKGAKADIASAGNDGWARFARTLRVARILGVELAAIVALAPYGAYAMSVYRRLPAVPSSEPAATGPGSSTQQVDSASPPLPQPPSAPPDLTPGLRALPPGRDGVAIHRQVSYGPAPRNVLDVYVPLVLPSQYSQQQQHHHEPPGGSASTPAETAGREGSSDGGHASSSGLLPVVFFLHGGVWASGETWQYAPMATRMAQAGMLVVVPTYTLYPEALTGTMVEEVGAALTWTFDNAQRYGGDPSRMSAVGHSAGGHLVAWALLRRAAAAQLVADAAVAAATSLSSPPAPTAPLSVTASPSNGSGASASSGDGSPGQHGSPVSSHKGPGPQPGQPKRGPRREDDQQQQPQDEGSAAHGGDARDTAAYLLGGGGTSFPSALHALRAVADAQLHPTPGVDVSVDDDGAAAEAAAAAARPAHGEVDTRMPRVFVGMSAVYDIAKHYEFEKSRAVHELSMMKRAVGGPAGFAAASPTVILASAANAAVAATASGGEAIAANAEEGGNGDSSDHRYFTSFFKSFELLGDAIPARAGLTDPEEGLLAGADTQASTSKVGLGVPGANGPGRGPGPAPPEARFSVAAAARLPPFIIMASCSDHMVPWHEGAEFILQLRRCGVPVRHLMYNHVGHGDFVMAWRPLDIQSRLAPPPASPLEEAPSREVQQQTQLGSCEMVTSPAGLQTRDIRGLLPCAKDLLRIVLGAVEPVRRPRRRAGQAGGEGAAAEVAEVMPAATAMAARSRL